jgi:endoglucanase
MHSPNEMISLDDVEATIRLIAAFARRLTPADDFLPR